MLTSEKSLSQAEDEALLRLIKPCSTRDELMLLLLRTYGMRASELLSLERRDITSTGNILVRGLKGSRDRELPLSREHLAKLKEFGGEDKLFPISLRRLQDIWYFFRPAKKRIHSLRHTCALQLYRKSKDLKLVQLVLGHRSINSTMVYADFVYEQERLREVFLHGSL